jgi:alpha-glucuronidase
MDVQPWEDASRGKGVSCAPLANRCSAAWTWSGQPGRFDIAVQYFDLQGGAAKFRLTVNETALGTWSADAKLPSQRPNGDNSSRYTARDIELKPGDVISVEGRPDGADPAALDYIELRGHNAK